jgi:hypothetical protein
VAAGAPQAEQDAVADPAPFRIHLPAVDAASVPREGPHELEAGGREALAGAPTRRRREGAVLPSPLLRQRLHVRGRCPGVVLGVGGLPAAASVWGGGQGEAERDRGLPPGRRRRSSSSAAAGATSGEPPGSIILGSGSCCGARLRKGRWLFVAGVSECDNCDVDASGQRAAHLQRATTVNVLE